MSYYILDLLFLVIKRKFEFTLLHLQRSTGTGTQAKKRIQCDRICKCVIILTYLSSLDIDFSSCKCPYSPPSETLPYKALDLDCLFSNTDDMKYALIVSLSSS